MYENTNITSPNQTYDTFYRDISLSEPKYLQKEEEVIEQYIQTLLQTKKDSIEFEEFGLQLEEYLFELPSSINAKIVFDAVIRAIQTYIKDIDIDFSRSSIDIDDDNGTYILTIVVYTKSGSEISVTKTLGMDMAYKE